ncbi:MAG: PTS sugar transporter subunit IIA [Candidatus Aureabacteria bacterium]|nr:PTS sugar transporter subunit IIA [Candidatus Auribacterota bacterium]
MECVQYLDCSTIILNLSGRTHEEVIAELVDTICQGGNGDRAKILKSIYTVEDIKNTAVGKGVAIPHGRTDAIPHLKLAFGRSERGVNWGSPDGNLVQMVWLIVNPKHQADEYLNVLSQITKISCRQNCREAIMLARDPAEIVRIVKECRNRERARN